MEISKELIQKIKEIPGTDGFYKHRTEDVFIRHAIFLKNLGVHEEIILQELENLYYAVSGEYGN